MMQTRLRDINVFVLHNNPSRVAACSLERRNRPKKKKKKRENEREKEGERNEKGKKIDRTFSRDTRTHGSLHDLSYGDNIFLPGRVGDRQ